MNRDARVVGDRTRERRAFETDQIHGDALRRQRLRVVSHTGTAAQIYKRDDDGSHDGRGCGGWPVFYLRARSFQKLATRLAATRRRYSAVDRTSSIGVISSRRMRCASAMVAPDESAASVLGSRTTVGPTLPIAMRGAWPRPGSTPATTTFEIACAARVPTLRNHCRPLTAGISTAAISSFGASTERR